ncbi:hypothetical protein GCM10028791_43130 [Echinicola sediminis]
MEQIHFFSQTDLKLSFIMDIETLSNLNSETNYIYSSSRKSKQENRENVSN